MSKSVKNIVKDYLTPRLPAMLYHGWDCKKIVDQVRGPIWEHCTIAGKSAAVSQMMGEVIKSVNLLPQTLEDVPAKQRLTTIPGESMERFPPTVSRWDNHSTSGVALEAASMLSRVQLVADEELHDILIEYLGALSIKDREDKFPARSFKELGNIDGEVFCVPHSTFDKADRMYATEKSSVSPMFNKVSRAMMVSPESRKTDVDLHRDHMSQLGLNESMVAKILENPVEYLIGGGDLDCMVQAISYTRIAATGHTTIPVGIDQVVSGYAHMMAMMRDPELFSCALPYRKGFEDPRWGLSVKLRETMPHLRKMSIAELRPLGKFVFTPCMYGAKKGGLFSHSTDKGNSVKSLEDEKGNIEVVKLPPLMAEALGTMAPRAQAEKLIELCAKWATAFGQAVPKVSIFGDHWKERWTSEKSATGMWFPRPDGTEVFLPVFKRNKYDTATYTTKWWEDVDGTKERVPGTATVAACKMDEKGTAVPAFIPHNRDAYTMALTVVYAKGVVMAGVHDYVRVMLMDEPIAQKAYTKAFNETHAPDPMDTGRAQLLIPEDEKMLRP